MIIFASYDDDDGDDCIFAMGALKHLCIVKRHCCLHKFPRDKAANIVSMSSCSWNFFNVFVAFLLSLCELRALCELP